MRREVMSMTKTFAFVTALSLLTVLALAPAVNARGGKDDAPQPPECQVEDGGVIICK